MRDAQLQALADELSKIAGLRDIWRAFTDYFRPEARKHRASAKAFVESEDPDKWESTFLDQVKNPHFVNQLRRAGADAKLVQHAKSMHGLQVGQTEGSVEGSTGKPYDIKKLPNGTHGCTCRDWRFRGSVNPGYECKHIRAFKAGMRKVAMARFGDMTEAFFDELENIQKSKRQAADKDWGPHGDSQYPFSSLLTQDEEPTLYNPTPAQAIEEPEVILGGNG